MKILGIESTAHTLGLGVYDSDVDRVVHVKDMYKTPKGEGMIPRKVADHHQQVVYTLLTRLNEQVKQEFGYEIRDVDGIAFSQGPGIGQCLQVGSYLARTLALRYEVPLIPVNHCQAHIEIGKWDTGLSDPLVIYVSGGNTQIIVQHEERYRVLGETLDIGLGNLFDVLGREIGLEYAHGSVLEKIARNGKYIQETPYSVKGMNFVFSGLLTHAVKRMIGRYPTEDIVYSVMHTAFAEITEAAERALCLTRKRELLLCGGVAQNMMFQGMLRRMCEYHDCSFGVPKNEFNSDNGGMIAYTGYLQYKKGITVSIEESKPKPRWRIDQI